MVRFVHAADVHLDSPLLGLTLLDAATRLKLRGVTREAFRQLVTQVLEQQADFLVIAGDLYDGGWKDVGTGLFFNQEVARLTAAKVPVVILHGNHDADTELRKLPRRDGVHTFSSRRPETIRLEQLNVALHGQSFPEPAVLENLVDKYPESERNVINIGVLHTGLEGYSEHARYAPCTLDQLKAKGYDYWALGHVHTHAVLHRAPWIVFPGNLQGRKINEPGPKGAMLVTVNDGQWQVDRLLVDVLRWHTLEVDVSEAVSIDDVTQMSRAKLSGHVDQTDSERSVAVRIRLRGATHAHGLMWGEERRVREDLLLVAAEYGEGRVLIEKIVNETTPLNSAVAAGEQTEALGDLQAYFAQAATDPEVALMIKTDLDRFVSSCPSEVRAQIDVVKAYQDGRIGDVWPATIRTASW